jgi:L-iditol 2-dehydrogenase
MRALVKEAAGPGHVVLCDWPVPGAGEGQVRIVVEAAGICGSDVHILHDDIKLLVRPPAVMGHEFCGVVDQVGAGVDGWQVGDRVTAETAVRTCGVCRSCRTGSPNRCSHKEILGYVHDGAFAERVVVDAHRLHRLPDSVDFIAGALTEPLACCIRLLVDMATVQPHDLVVVAGPGAIGILCGQVARAAGARVCLVGTAEDTARLRVAEEVGLTSHLIAGRDDVTQAVLDASDGEGCDVYVEASGSPAAARAGLELLRRNGQYAQIGLASGPFPLELSTLAYKELRMVGSLGQVTDGWRRALGLMESGAVHTRPLATHVLPLSQWQEGFRLFEFKEAIKVVFLPGQ